ncbi:hypothetical protein [Nocardioides sp.]|uniref:hypothetical protein n=1 Tax=Nocardioides sp. TaxID=35761 RepID=UPI00262F9558|nr:hypothetical protein [Nocardioides sp.]
MLTRETVRHDDAEEVVSALASWQHDATAVQWHPGDLGWAWRFGAARCVADLRMWRRDGEPVAAGTVEDGVLRMALSPAVFDDSEVADRLADDLTDPDRGVLPAGRASVEVRDGATFRTRLIERGWLPDELWTPFRRDLATPVPDPGVEIVVLDREEPDEAVLRDRVAVHRAAFSNSTFSVARWPPGLPIGVPAA